MWRPFKRRRSYGGVSISEGNLDMLEAVSWIAYFIVEIAKDN